MTTAVIDFRLDTYIRATQNAIAYNVAGINWAKQEVAWADENNFEWAKEHGEWAKECLSEYEAELVKSEAHLEELRNRKAA